MKGYKMKKLMKESKEGDNTFIRITNRDLWDMINKIHDKMELVDDKVDEVISQQKYTNGKVRLNRAWLYGLTAGVCTGFLFLLKLIVI